MSGSPATDSNARVRLRGKRAALAIYGTFASVFVALSTWQLVAGVFGGVTMPLAAGSCSDDLRALRSALDRGLATAVAAPDAATALDRYRRAISPEWGIEKSVADRCAAEPRGTDAYVLLLRLRLAQEASLRGEVAAMAPLRRDLGAYLP